MNMKNFTGERLETFINSEVAIEHLHRYAVVLGLAKGKNVLDIASGEGYGSNLIADVAAKVTGVDISRETIQSAKAKYQKRNLEFIEGSASKIPLESGQFDLVVSFETIEHHDQHEEMLSEIKRVLKPDGIIVISSPDKLYYTDKRNYHNKYHIKELYANEFKALMGRYFKNTSFFNQRATFMSLLVPENDQFPFLEYSGNYDGIFPSPDFAPMYNLCIASNGQLPAVVLTAFTDDYLVNRITDATIEKVRGTASYKIGHFILWPFKAVRKMMS